MHRLVTIATATAITLAAVATASAEPATLNFSGGLGVEAMSACDDFGTASYGCPGETHQLVGFAPVLGATFIKKTTPKHGFAFRFGPELTASMVSADGARGVMVGGMMTVGLHFHRLFAETGGGLSVLSFKYENVSSRAGTMYLHSGLGIELDDEWALTGRIDAHAMMHVPMSALIVAGGITYTPR